MTGRILIFFWLACLFAGFQVHAGSATIPHLENFSTSTLMSNTTKLSWDTLRQRLEMPQRKTRFKPFLGASGNTLNGDAFTTQSVAVGDLNGDGHLDIVVPASSTGITNKIYFNSGNANPFADVSTNTLSSDLHDTTDVVLADIDNDGDLDVLLGNKNSTSDRLYLNNGTSDPFQGVSGLNISSDTMDTQCLAVADLDGDGYKDVIAGAEDALPRIYFHNRSANPFNGVSGNTLPGNASAYRRIHVVDLNHDGHMDIIMTAKFIEGPGINQFYLNNGTSDPFNGVSSANITDDNDATQASAVGDVDGDGDVDYLAGNNGVNKLYLNNGTAMPFNGVTATTVGISRNTKGIQLVDIDGDGDLDILQVVTGDKNVLMLNNGTANPFTGAIEEEISSDSESTREIAVGDLDGDGDIDMVVANYGQINKIYFNHVSQNPFNGVTAKTITGDAESTYTIAVADLNRDGHPDVVTGTTNGQQQNKIYYNTGSIDPFAGVSGNILTYEKTRGIAIADMNHDGFLDIVTANWDQDHKVFYQKSNGADFNSVTGNVLGVGNSGNTTVDVAVGDLNGDGHPDIVLANDGQINTIFYHNGTNSPFEGVSGNNLSTEAEDTKVIKIVDIDSDGDLDILANPNALYLNNGTSEPFDGVTKKSIGTIMGGGACTGIAAGDLDGDGDLDVVIGHDGAPNMYFLNNGTSDPFNGVSGANIDLDNQTTREVALLDFDKDGDLDVVSINYNQVNRIYLNNGTSTPFISSVPGMTITSETDFSEDMATADMDGDGWQDIVVGNRDQSNDMYLSAGNTLVLNTTLVASTNLMPTLTDNKKDLAVGDVDGDGDIDVVIGVNSGNMYYYPNSGNVNAPFSISTRQAINEPAGGDIKLFDIDSDGDLDLFKFISSNQENKVLLNNGTSTPFTGVTAKSITSDAHNTWTGDFGDVDNDGDIDLVVNNQNQTTRLYLNNGTSDPFNGVTGSDVHANTHSSRNIILADMDRDGNLDVVLGVHGINKLYLNNGTSDPFNGVTEKNITSDNYNTHTMSVGDIDGDGDLDVVTGTYTNGIRDRVYLNNGTADPFAGVSGYDMNTNDTGQLNANGSQLIDVDRDGDLDFLMARQSVGNRGLRLYLNDGSTTPFSNVTGTNLTTFDEYGYFVDIDRDGYLELINSQNNGGLHLVDLTAYDTSRLVAQSNTIDNLPDNILKGKITASANVSRHTSIDYYLTNNGGTNWYQVTTGSYFTFPTTGSNLMWRTVMHSISPSTSASIDTLLIETSIPPVFNSLNGDSASYTEGDSPVLVEQGSDATVTDSDSADFNNGTLSVTFTSNGNVVEDRLALRHVGVASGELGVFGSNVTYEGSGNQIAISTFTQSTGKLSFTLSTNANANALTALIRNLTYENTNHATPSTGTRTLTYALTDGDGGMATSVTSSVTITAVNDVPSIASLQGDAQNYTPGTSGNLILDLGSNAALSDLDTTSSYNGGYLRVEIAAGGNATQDSLSIKSVGNSAGQIGVSGSAVSYGGTQIGTLTTSTGNLLITFNASADSTSVVALISHITFATSGTNIQTGERSIRFNLSETGSSSRDSRVAITVLPKIGLPFYEDFGTNTFMATGNVVTADWVNDENQLRLKWRKARYKSFIGVSKGDFNSSHNSQDVQLADMNGDGHLDVVLGVDGINRLYLTNGSSSPFTGVVEKNITSDSHDTSHIALADIDRDGDLDAIVANNGAKNRIYYNNGTADPFNGVTGVDLSTLTDNSRQIEAGDLNGDGHLDLVVANVAAAKLIYYNNGTSTPFAGVTGVSFDSNSNAYVVRLADIDNDGDLDILVGNFGSTNRYLLNNGTSDPFNGVTAFNISTDTKFTIDMAVGDIDGDGDLDVVTANNNEAQRVYRNDGDSSPFSSLTGNDISSQTGGTNAIRLFDIDSDGDLDVIVGNIGNSDNNLIHYNDGSSEPFVNTIGVDLTSDATTSTGLAIGDINDDGLPDIVASNSSGADFYYLNNSSENPFAGTTAQLIANTQWKGSDIGDVDGDGNLDLVIAVDGVNQLLLNNGTSTPFAGISSNNISNDSDDSSGILLADFDSDGDLDAFVTNGNSTVNKLYLNNGTSDPFNGVVAESLSGNVGQTVSAKAADFDNDGDLDIVSVDSNILSNNDGGFEARIFLNNGSTNPFDGVSGNKFHVSGNIPIYTDDYLENVIDVGDLNDDGHIDLIIGKESHIAYYILNNKTSDPFAGTSARTISGNGLHMGVRTGDFDKDGDLDYVFANHGGADKYILNDGSGNLFVGQNELEVSTLSTNARCIETADLNRDGLLDLIVGNKNQADHIVLNNGTSTPFSGPAYTISSSHLLDTTSIEVADMNGDGYLDIIAGHKGSASYLYLNMGNVTPFVPTQFQSSAIAGGAGTKFTDVAAADFNGDGHVDFIQKTNAGETQLFLNNGTRHPFLNVAPKLINIDVSTISAVDLDLDGDLDLIGKKNLTYRSFVLNNGTADPFAGASATKIGSAGVNDIKGMDFGDFNRDGYPDVVTSGASPEPPEYYQNSRKRDPLGLVSSSNITTDSINGILVQAGDFDGDGDEDLIVIDDGGLNKLYQNNGTSTPFAGISSVQVTSDALASKDMVLGDVDGDGDLDLIVGSGTSGNDRVYLNNGTSTPFNGVTGYNVLNTSTKLTRKSSSHLVDLDRDGDLDYVTTRSDTGVQAFLSEGGSTPFATVSANLFTSTESKSAIADFDGDGYLDLALGGASPAIFHRQMYNIHMGRVESKTIDSVSGNIYQAVLSANVITPKNTSIDYYLSNSGGNQWFQVHAGNIFTFPTTGSDLRWAAQLHSGSPVRTPVINSITVEQRHPPVIAQGNAIAVTMSEDGSPTAWSAPSITATDADGHALTWSVNIQPTQGTLSLTQSNNAITSLVYTPNVNVNGSDSFLLEVSDGTTSTNTQVNVTITAVNDAPVFTIGANVDITMSEDGSPTSFSGPNIAATDVDGDVLTWSVNTISGNGTSTITGGGRDPLVMNYTPAGNFHGLETVVVRVADTSGAYDDLSVAITVTPVNDAPVGPSGNLSVSMSEDGSPTAWSAPSFNVSDVDGDTISWAVSANPTNGSVSVSGTGANPGSLVYTPTGNFHGTDAFTLTYSDGNGASGNAIVDVTIASVNDAPIIAQGTSVSVTMSEDSSPTAWSPPTLSATDVDGDSLTWSVNAQPSKGSVTLSGSTPTYTPNANANGTDSFVLDVSDGNGGSDAITVNVTIQAVNDAPILTGTGTSVTMSEDSSPTAYTAPTLTGTDVDGDTLTWSIQTAATKGTATVNSSGVTTYTPNANVNGSDSFVVRVSDGSLMADLTISVSITAVADAPVIAQGTSVSVTMSEDATPTAYSAPSLTATDGDGDTLTWSISSAASKGTASVNASSGVTTYTPNANANGSDSFVVRVSDGGLTDTISVNITLQSVNDLPLSTGGNADMISNSTLIFGTALFNYSDVETTGFDSLRVDHLPTRGTLTISGNAATAGSIVTSTNMGQLAFTPTTNSFGIAYTTFAYSVSDGIAFSANLADFRIDVVDRILPHIVSSSPVSGTRIRNTTSFSLSFSENVIATTTAHGALNLSNYRLSGTAATGAQLSSVSGSQQGPYVLQLNGALANGSLSLSVNNIHDDNANLLIPANLNWQVDITAPHVIRATTHYGPVNTFRVHFSENVLEGSGLGSVMHLPYHSFTHSRTGQSVAATSVISAGGNAYDLAFDVTLGDGLWTYTVNGITDLAGNPLVPFTQTFILDRTKPSITSVLPADQSVLPAKVSLQITFSENVLLASVLDTANYAITHSAGEAVAIVSISGNGAGPYLLDLGSVKQEGTLRITISKVSDTLGNLLDAASITYTVKPLSIVRSSNLSVGAQSRLWLAGGQGVKTYTSSDTAVITVDASGTLSGLQTGTAKITVSDEIGNTVSVDLQVLTPVNNQVTRAVDAFQNGFDYKLTSFPFYLGASAAQDLQDKLRPTLGDMNDANYLLWGFVDGVANPNFELLGTSGVKAGPGYGFWFGSVNAQNLSVNLPGPALGDIVDIQLHQGWNIVGNPYASAIKVTDLYVEIGGVVHPIKSNAQQELGHHLWYIEKGFAEYLSLDVLDAGLAAWLYVKPVGGIRIFFAPTTAAAKASSKAKGTFASQLDLSDEPLPPTPPYNSSASAGSALPTSIGGGGGGGGCFIMRGAWE